MARELNKSRDPTALLVIRVVIERGSSAPLRAYIRQTGNVSLGFERPSTVTDVEATLALARTWLEHAIEAGASTDGVAAPPP